MKKIVLLSFAILYLFSTCLAQETVDTPSLSILEELTNNSDSSKGTIILNQDPRIKDLLLKKKESDLQNQTFTTKQGFRVQVFSSNEQHNAKTNAYKTEERIRERLPEAAVYTSFSSPFWKVRVGDCLTTTEAQQLRDVLKKEFPEFQQEIYIVKDQIQVPEE
ncbi:MAG: SPOR domain-containing protein [Prevotellaceae bacterium]|jgi:hypothetical protein|nr:SPOR domain-containing protein [Prevotellaceae bacterium]